MAQETASAGRRAAAAYLIIGIVSIAYGFAIVTMVARALRPGTDVTTYKNDLSRTGQNLNETWLTPDRVRSLRFGLLRQLPVDGPVFAQPLYLSRLTTPHGQHNVVYVVTEHNSAYAYDVDSGILLWRSTFNLPGETAGDDHGCNQIGNEIGVTATPVIDRKGVDRGALYAVAMSKDVAGIYHQRLHALDLVTGVELFGGPREIDATFLSPKGVSTTFLPANYKERAALLLLNGEIFTTWASHCDNAPYGGWIIAFSATTLRQTRVLNLGGSGDESGPGIWMAGGGPAADDNGNIYLLSSNGPFETSVTSRGFPSGQDYGNSFVKLSARLSNLDVVDFFAMSNVLQESRADLDLGSGGVMLLPAMRDQSGTLRRLAVGAGKDGNIYVVDTNSMGKYSALRNNIWQELAGVVPQQIRSTPAYFSNTVYYSEVRGPIKAFKITNAMLSLSPTSVARDKLSYPGTVPVVSGNGNAGGIVWSANSTNGGTLSAYDAENLSKRFYSNHDAPNERDKIDGVTKFATPTVADGRVLVGTHSGVAIFGLLE